MSPILRIVFWVAITAGAYLTMMGMSNWDFKGYGLIGIGIVLIFTAPILVYNLSFNCDSDRAEFICSLICKVWTGVWIGIMWNSRWTRNDAFFNALMMPLLMMFAISSFYMIFRDALLESDRAMALYDILVFVSWVVFFVPMLFIKGKPALYIAFVMLGIFVLGTLVEFFSMTRIGAALFGKICGMFTGRKSTRTVGRGISGNNLTIRQAFDQVDRAIGRGGVGSTFNGILATIVGARVSYSSTSVQVTVLLRIRITNNSVADRSDVDAIAERAIKRGEEVSAEAMSHVAPKYRDVDVYVDVEAVD